MSSQSLGTLVSDELISELQRLFPSRSARKGQPIEEIWIEAGHQEVIEKIIAEKAAAEENILHPS